MLEESKIDEACLPLEPSKSAVNSKRYEVLCIPFSIGKGTAVLHMMHVVSEDTSLFTANREC
jgi:hypothetical protein